jgi:hypothetical protein
MNGTDTITSTYYDNSSGTDINGTGTINNETVPVTTSALTSTPNSGANVAGSTTGSNAWIWIILLILIVIAAFYFFSRKGRAV